MIVGSVALAAATLAQPANDNFAQRLTIIGTNIAVSGSLSNATAEVGELLLPGISSGQTAWWTWTAPSNGIVNLSVSATNFNPLLTAYTGTDISTLLLVASNNYQICYADGACGCHWRERDGTTFHVARGESYQIAVDSAIWTDASMGELSIPVTNDEGVVDGDLMYWGPSFNTNVNPGGDLTMQLQFTPTPRNDDFENRVALFGSQTRTQTSNAGATKQAGEPNHLGNPGGSSVWFSWTAPASGRVTLSTNNIPPYLPPSWTDGNGVDVIDVSIGPPSCGEAIDQNPPPVFYPLLAAYTGIAVDSLASANCLPMSLEAYPHAVEFDAIKGQTYPIAFDGNMGTTGDLTMYLALTRPAVNDNFKDRVHLHGVYIAANGFNAGATHENGEPIANRSTGKSVWWSWTAPVTGTVTVNLTGSDYSFPLAVFTGNSVSDLTQIATGQGNASFNATQGKVYQIGVYDAAGLTGQIKFTLTAPVIELPLLRNQSASWMRLLSFRASPGQVALLQTQRANRWCNVAVAQSRSTVVWFALPRNSDMGNSYRAVVIDYNSAAMPLGHTFVSVDHAIQQGEINAGYFPPVPSH